jgi:uncharacterized membrane protein SirB2
MRRLGHDASCIWVSIKTTGNGSWLIYLFILVMVSVVFGAWVLPLSLCNRFQRIFIMLVDLVFMYVLRSSRFGNTPLL